MALLLITLLVISRPGLKLHMSQSPTKPQMSLNLELSFRHLNIPGKHLIRLPKAQSILPSRSLPEMLKVPLLTSARASIRHPLPTTETELPATDDIDR